jgi:hypothetical protein
VAQFKRRAPAEHTDRPARRPRDGADRTDRSAA